MSVQTMEPKIYPFWCRGESLFSGNPIQGVPHIGGPLYKGSPIYGYPYIGVSHMQTVAYMLSSLGAAVPQTPLHAKALRLNGALHL